MRRHLRIAESKEKLFASGAKYVFVWIGAKIDVIQPWGLNEGGLPEIRNFREFNAIHQKRGIYLNS